MNKNSVRPHRFAAIRNRILQSTVLGALLSASVSIGVGVPVVSAANLVVGTSTHARAYQHSAADKVAYLHDGSLLVGFFDGSKVVIQQITNPGISPAAPAPVETITGGSEVTLYTLPNSPTAGQTEIWIAVGNELYGQTKREQIQYVTYNGSAFTLGTVYAVPGALTNGRQDPTVTWTGKWLIVAWWDDTKGGNTDSVFVNWTTDKTGATGWLSKSGTTASFLNSRNGTTAAATIVTAPTITYNPLTGGAPVNGVYVFGSGTVNSEVDTVTAVSAGPAPYTLTLATPLVNPHAVGEIDTVQSWTITYTAVTGGAPLVGDWYQFGDGSNAEYRQLTAVVGSNISFAGLVNAHSTGETDTQEAAIQLTVAGSTISQVSIRHSAKLGATVAVYGARSHMYTRSLLDTKANPSLANWSAESQVDPAFDDSESGFGGPQIAIDETTGNIHVFRAVTTAGGPGYQGVTYWLGKPDATPMVTGTVTWNPRLTIDSTATLTDPPDIAGAVDSTGKVYVFWATKAVAGTINYVTLDSPYTAASAPVTVPTVGANPRFPHVPAQAPLTRGIVPLVYQSGSGTSFTINFTAVSNFVGYSSLGGGLIGGPDASASSASKTDVFVTGTDLQLWHKSWNGSVWDANWEPLGGVLTSDPGAVAAGPTNINVFVRGSDNQLWEKDWNGSAWSGWQPLGGKLTAGPDPDQWGNGAHVDVYVRGTDYQMWHKWSDNGTWYNWEPLGGVLTSDPGAVSWGTQRADVFVRGTDNQLYHKWWDGIAWRNWEALGGGLTSGPDVASCTAATGSANGHLDVFVIGTDGQLWRKGFNGSSWGQWEPLGGMWTGGVGAACNPANGAVDVYLHGSDNALWTVSVPAS
jgi:hypothetical protein